jgi:putative membrane protein
MSKKGNDKKASLAIDWALRLLKGTLIGTGFILPGVSGGALAAIFGLYERIIAFMSHLNRNFKKNLIFFIPVILGMGIGIVGLSYPLSFFLEQYLAPTMWFFIGCIIGIIPTLWKQAGKKGRRPRHYAIGVVAFSCFLAFLILGGALLSGQVPLNFGTWILAGAIIALGVLLPGLSPSNLLLYMGMYAPMVDAFKTLDLLTILAIIIGGLACMLIFSRLINKLFEVAYAGLFHVIFGAVIASTLMIVPLDFDYLSLGGLAALGACIAGIALGWWMSRLEDKYKPQDD